MEGIAVNHISFRFWISGVVPEIFAIITKNYHLNTTEVMANFLVKFPIIVTMATGVVRAKFDSRH